MIALPSLQQLRFLAAVADTHHFGRAAESCAVTQSTLSAGIQELESRLGVTLIERSRRGVILTPLGEEIVMRGRQLLRDAGELAELAQTSREPMSLPLRLGVIPTIAPYLVPALMQGLPATFPKLKLYLREEQTAPLLAQLSDGKLDLVLLALPYATDDLETMELGTDPILAVMPRDHPLARQSQITQDALAGEKLLLMEDGHCLRSHALEACRLADPNRNEVFQGTSLRTVVQMAAGGLGVTLVPRMALAQELPQGGTLVARPLGDDAPPRHIALTWRRGAARRSEFQRFGDYAKLVLAGIPGGNLN
jgi:LysR family hydrogen peroxide-inducible transcriptional activator